MRKKVSGWCKINLVEIIPILGIVPLFFINYFKPYQRSRFLWAMVPYRLSVWHFIWIVCILFISIN